LLDWPRIIWPRKPEFEKEKTMYNYLLATLRVYGEGCDPCETAAESVCALLADLIGYCAETRVDLETELMIARERLTLKGLLRR
jgi:hypothetical protein